jgi:hypothetical protein
MLDYEREQLRRIALSFYINIVRIRNLVTFSSKVLAGKTPLEEFDLQWELEAYLDNVLRVAVVFLHAALEDALREIVRLKLREQSGQVLDDIPLVGTSSANRPTKFALGRLSEHRGKTIDEVIQESVDKYLDKTSFNSTDDIAGTFEKKIEVDLSDLRRYFTSLDEMIQRRHQIVHTVDRPRFASFQAHIDVSNVRDWTATVVDFVAEVITKVFPPEDSHEARKCADKDPGRALHGLALELAQQLEEPNLVKALEELGLGPRQPNNST